GARGGPAQTSFGGARAATPGPQPPAAAGPTAGAATVPRWVVNALIGAADDPEAMVRSAAVEALGLTGEQRVTVPLVSHLDDHSRIVRVDAAQALLQLGVVRLDGAPGVALERAQNEYAVSLSTFRDGAQDHVSLGWLEAQRGDPAAAARQLNTALDLNPADSRAHVYLGVIAARAGRYDEAIKQWEQAKALDKQNPNIDRLISMARKRLSGKP
ncbi:MAG: tetratricopeptide repeat protein, partial [Acidobacteriota bacterium]|nr:tetratricopeptide repeat protein [Acidobacteriota bacterium]